MPDCVFLVLVSGEPAKGREVTYTVLPPVKSPCSFSAKVNGQPAAPGDIGHLHVAGIGASGALTLRPLTDPPEGSVSITVRCSGEQSCGSTQTFDVSPEAARDLWLEWFATLMLPLTLALLMTGAILLVLALTWMFVLGDPGPLRRLLGYLRVIWDLLPRWVHRWLRRRII